MTLRTGAERGSAFVCHLSAARSLDLRSWLWRGESLPTPKAGYRSYTGIDISDVAIGRCRQFGDDKTSCFVGDAESYVPSTTFDVIALNGSIYYFSHPISALQRLATFLVPSGIVDLSLFHMDRTHSIRQGLKSRFLVADETVVSNSRGTWHCLVLCREHPSRTSNATGS